MFQTFKQLKAIKQVNRYKILGATVAKQLTWKPNTQNICREILYQQSYHLEKLLNISQDF